MLRVETLMRRALVAVSFLVVLVMGLAGCGRRATRVDCEHFLDKNIEVKLKSEGVTDGPAIQKRQTELRAQLQEDVDRCVGRRITDSMLGCVDRAQVDKDIDKCLR